MGFVLNLYKQAFKSYGLPCRIMWKKDEMLARNMQLTKQLYNNSGDSSIKLKQTMNDLIDYSKSIFVHLIYITRIMDLFCLHNNRSTEYMTSRKADIYITMLQVFLMVKISRIVLIHIFKGENFMNCQYHLQCLLYNFKHQLMLLLQNLIIILHASQYGRVFQSRVHC